MAITITTTSSTSYMSDRNNAIYPAYNDGISYRSWAPPTTPYVSATSIATHFREYFPLVATGGTGSTYTWSLQSGNLPVGMTLQSNGRLVALDGVKSEGSYTFTVGVENNGEIATKQLTIESKPFASKWYRDAKFGVIIHWGRMTDVQITTITGNSEFQSRITEFDANEWAAQLQTWGCKVLHFSVIWQDSFRNWPSIYPTRYELKSSRDIVGELITACHAVGIKVIGYYSPDFQNLPLNLTDVVLPNIVWWPMNQAFVIELIDKGLDGIWFDSGGAAEMPEIGAINQWMYWDSMIPQIEFRNPDFIWGVNPGVRRGGTKLFYPHTDFVIYEAVAVNSTSASLLEVATPPDGKKKMASDVSNMICANFVFGPNGYTQPKKDLNGVIKNIAKNWENGGTVMIALPVQANGDLRHPNFASYFDTIGAYVSANQGFSADPTLITSNNSISISAPNRARIYYTTNGKQPTDKDFVYISSIPINKNTKLKTRTKELNKPLGFVAETKIESFSDVPENEKTLFRLVSGDTLAQESGEYYRGMLITVGSSPILINKIGRKSNGNISLPHDYVIKRYYDNYPIQRGTILNTLPLEDGYQFADVSNIRLEAGMSYIIGVKENAVDYYYSNTFSTIPPSSDLRIISPLILSKNGDRYPVPSVFDGIGQFVNLKYTVLSTEQKYDVALGKPVTFTSNTSGNQLGPSGISYAVNATDGDPISVARAGGEYAYTLNVDLLEIQKINKIVIRFDPEGWAVDFAAYISLNGVVSQQNIVGQRTNNSVKTVILTFPEVATRYVHIRATKPNAQGQLGGQMSVINLEVYND